MYKVPYFRETDREVIDEFMRAHPFALIMGTGFDGKPVATQAPVLFDERDGQLILTGHILRGSDHWHGFGANPDVLAVFTGPNCSVKASWYLGLESGGTWNYVSVQAKGTVRLLDQPALVNVLKRLTAQVEGDANSGSNFEDLSDAYTSKMLPAIQAFEITVTNLDAIFKLSQNRDEASYDNVMEKLTERGGNSAAIAEMMLKRREKLFADS